MAAPRCPGCDRPPPPPDSPEAKDWVFPWIEMKRKVEPDEKRRVDTGRSFPIGVCPNCWEYEELIQQACKGVELHARGGTHWLPPLGFAWIVTVCGPMKAQHAAWADWWGWKDHHFDEEGR